MVAIRAWRPAPSGGAPVEVDASVEHGVWQCADPAFLAVLQTLNLPSGYHPDPDAEKAQRAVSIYGGSVIDKREAPATLPPEGLTDLDHGAPPPVNETQERKPPPVPAKQPAPRKPTVDAAAIHAAVAAGLTPKTLKKLRKLSRH